MHGTAGPVMPPGAGPAPLRVVVLIGSTREGRVGDEVGRWFIGQAALRTDVEPVVLDLADFEFPSRYPGEPTPQMALFTAEIGRAEGFVVVTPEYNRSFPASLKQAIDYAYDEWRAKPVGFVSYGCRSEGMYAVEHLRSVFTELHTVTMRDGVGFDLLAARSDTFLDTAEQAARAMLDQLVWWGLALREARAARPYAS